MSTKRPAKRSSLALKGQNATLDQYFSVKKIKHNENTVNASTNENDTADHDKSKIKNNTYKTTKDDAKTKQRQASSPLSEQQKQPLKDQKTHIQKRQPLADISDTPNCLNIPATEKPRLPAFVVLRDEEIDQGATEANQQQQCSLSTPLPVSNSTQLTLEESPTQSVPIADTQSSIITSLSSPVAIASQESFFSDEYNGIEFRLDAFESDNIEDEHTDDDHDDNHATSFFDDEQPSNDILGFLDDNEADDEQNPLCITKTYRRSHRRPTAVASPTRLDSSSETEESPTKQHQDTEKEDPLQPEEATPTLEFSISNSLSIPLDIKANYLSDDEEDSSPPENIKPARQVSHLSTSTASSSSPIRSIDQPTLPMSLSFDESTEVHVAYPFPRGKSIPDKFGASHP